MNGKLKDCKRMAKLNHKEKKKKEEEMNSWNGSGVATRRKMTRRILRRTGVLNIETVKNCKCLLFVRRCVSGGCGIMLFNVPSFFTTHPFLTPKFKWTLRTIEQHLRFPFKILQLKLIRKSIRRAHNSNALDAQTHTNTH